MEPQESMDFGKALLALRRGECVTRLSWRDPVRYLEMWVPVGRVMREMRRPQGAYLFGPESNVLAAREEATAMLIEDSGSAYPWSPHEADVFGTDWVLIKEEARR